MRVGWWSKKGSFGNKCLRKLGNLKKKSKECIIISFHFSLCFTNESHTLNGKWIWFLLYIYLVLKIILYIYMWWLFCKFMCSTLLVLMLYHCDKSHETRNKLVTDCWWSSTKTWPRQSIDSTRRLSHSSSETCKY